MAVSNAIIVPLRNAGPLEGGASATGRAG